MKLLSALRGSQTMVCPRDLHLTHFFHGHWTSGWHRTTTEYKADQHVAGKTGVIFQIHNELLFGLMLGHEDIFPDLARQYARDSADLLIILLDSKRFNGTPLHVQHTRRAKLSAVAVGLPMLRCNNSLASQVITNTGRVIEDLRFGSSPDPQPRAAVMNVPLTAHATLYRWIGDTGVIAVLVLGMFGGLFGAGPIWRRIVRL